MKIFFYRYTITQLMDKLPCLYSGVRYACTAIQVPRKEMAHAIILPLPTHRFKQDILYIFATVKYQDRPK